MQPSETKGVSSLLRLPYLWQSATFYPTLPRDRTDFLPYLLRVDSLKHIGRVCVPRIQLQRLLVVLDGELALVVGEIRFGQAVIGVEGVRINGNIQFENLDRLFDSLFCEKEVTQGVQLGLTKVVGVRLGFLQLVIELEARFNAFVPDYFSDDVDYGHCSDVLKPVD